MTSVLMLLPNRDERRATEDLMALSNLIVSYGAVLHDLDRAKDGRAFTVLQDRRNALRREKEQAEQQFMRRFRSAGDESRT